jgi:DnaB-like helicase N terminal domain/AAA domain
VSGNSVMAQPLPHSLEAERAVLGAILVGSSGTDDAISTTQPGDFYIPRHQVIFRHMKFLRDRGLPYSDLVLLCDSLQSTGELEKAGEMAYLGLLANECHRGINLGHYVKIVRLNASLRRKANIGQNIVDLALSANGNAAEVLTKISMLSDHLREEVGQKRKLNFVSGAEFAAAMDEPIEWIVFGYVARGAISEIGAKVKAGKTTLVAALVRAAADGADFLGHPTLKTPTVYLTEQPAVSFRQTLKRADLLGRCDFHFLLRGELPDMPWPEVVASAVDKCKQVGAKLLVIDTLPQFAGLPGDSENNAGDALAAMEPLQRAAAQKIGIISVRHDRKSGGDVADSGRGSSAFAGVSDIVISLRRPEGNSKDTLRVLKAVSRFSETPTELVVELTANGYIALGDTRRKALDGIGEAILAKVPTSEGEAVRIKDLEAVINLGRITIHRALEELVEKGELVRVGKGKRNDPFRYFKSEIPFCPTSLVKEQHENTNQSGGKGRPE